MPKTQVNCPNCRKPVVADIEQLFDVNADPSAKSRLLSGSYNFIQCPLCGYQGVLATPIVYHDPSKELLLTFLPPELGLPRNEQERLIGSLINQVINKLPQEKRKGYLLNPLSTLTMQGLIERVLEADGITKDMIQAQQKKLNLIQRLASTSDDKTRAEIAQQENEIIDADFFAIMSRLAEAALASGDRDSARQIAELQKSLLPITTYGRQIQAQTNEIEKAVKDLQAAGKDLDREKLLEMVINAENETRLSALISLTRPLMDYSFFQLLSERIDRARGEGRDRLVELRARLLEMTEEIDRQLEAHRKQTRQIIDAVLQSENIDGAMNQIMPAVDEIFIQELEKSLHEARKSGDLARSAKIQQMVDSIQKASTPTEEIRLIEEYLDFHDEKSRQKFLENNATKITPQFLETLASIALQFGQDAEKDLVEHITAANIQAIRFSMSKNLEGG